MKNKIPDVITSEYIRESWSKMSEPMQEMITLLLDKIKYHQDQLNSFNAIDNRASFRSYLTGLNIILKDKYGTYQFNPILFDLNFNMRGPIAQMVTGQLKEKVRKQAATQSATYEVDEAWEEIQPINIQDEVREKVENVLDQNPQFKVTPQEKNKIVEIMFSQPDGVITMNRILKVFKQLRKKQDRSTLRKKIGFGGNKTRRIRKKIKLKI
jgi:hypothetical protein